MITDTRQPQTPRCPNCAVMMDYAGIRKWTSAHIVAIHWPGQRSSLAKPSTMTFKCPSCATTLASTVVTVYERDEPLPFSPLDESEMR